MRDARVSWSGPESDVLAVYEASFEGANTAGDGIEAAGEWDVLTLVAYDRERDEPLYDTPVGVEIQAFSRFSGWESVPNFGALWRVEGSEAPPMPLADLLEAEQRLLKAGCGPAPPGSP